MLRFLRKYKAVFVFWFAVLVLAAPVFAQIAPDTSTTPGILSEIFSNPFSGTSGMFSSFPLSWLMGLLSGLFYLLLSAVDSVAVFLAWLTGSLMDYMFYYTVVNFTPTFMEMNSPGMTVSSSNTLIYYAWSIVRDILNAGVFFVVIYHAIRAMFKGFEDIKKRFIGLLVFVVLVNFSLLFVKLVADISNIAMLQMYNAAARPVSSATTKEFFTHKDDTKATGLSSFVLNAVNPISFFSEGRYNLAVDTQIKQNSQSAMFQLALIAIHLYLAFLFLYVAAILGTRAVTFIVIMIASPLLVAGMFFSGLSDVAKRVKDELLEEALQGPGMVFLLLLSAMIVSSLFTGSGFENFTTSSSGQPSVFLTNMGIFLKFFIFVGFNYYAFSFIRKMTTTGGNWSEKLFAAGLGGAIGLTGWGLRRTIGGGANYLLNNDNHGKNWADAALNGTGWEKRIASAKFKTARFLSNRTFDGRTGMSAFQKTAIGGRILTSLKTGLPMPDLKVGKGTDKTAASLQKKKDEKENKRRDDFRQALAESGSALYSVRDKRLINEGLVKADYAGKSRDIRDLEDMANSINSRYFQSQIADLVLNNKGDTVVETTDRKIKLTAKEWQDLIAQEPVNGGKVRNILARTANLSDDDEINIGGEIKKVKDWKTDADKLSKQMVDGAVGEAKKQLSDITKREKLVAKYAEKSKGDIEEAFDREQGKGNISYVAELPARALRRAVRRITREQRSGGDSRANMKAAKRYEQRINSDKTVQSYSTNRSRQNAVGLMNNSIRLKNFVSKLGPETNDFKKDLSVIEEYIDKGSSYTSVGEKWKMMPNNQRDKVSASITNILDNLSGSQKFMQFEELKEFRSLVNDQNNMIENIKSGDDKIATMSAPPKKDGASSK